MTKKQLINLQGKTIRFQLPAFKHAVHIDTYEGVVQLQEYHLANSKVEHINLVLVEALKNGLKCTHDIVIMWNRLNEITNLEVL